MKTKFARRFLVPTGQKGLPPGTAVYTGEKTDVTMRIRVIHYNEGEIEELEPGTIEETFAYAEAPPTTWINIDGLHEIDVVQGICKHIDLHPLVIEDILHTHQRAKMEDLGSSIFIVMRMLMVDPEIREVRSEQISFVLHGNTLISFQEVPGDVFDDVRERIRTAQGRIRKKGADYLLHALMDAIVDNYFKVLEHFGEEIEQIESDLMEDAYPELLSRIYNIKRELIFVRKAVWPLRETVGALERSEHELIDASSHAFLRDLYDHTIQVIDTIESFRDMVSGVQDLYLSSLGNKTNQVMQLLTIIATIFIPITFVAGIYGMNFDVIPELHWKYGYAGVWTIMISMVVCMLVYFRRKNWL